MSCIRQPRPHALDICLLSLLIAILGNSADAQRPIHSLYRSDMRPGAISASQAQSGSRHGYVQPVQFIVPDGAIVSAASGAGFTQSAPDIRVGVLLGHAYRLQISNIPRHQDLTLYPSVEVLDRLHPPTGQKNRFPIPIEITQEDLELARQGSMVVRVIYLENPENAFPERDTAQQRSMDVLPAEDPLHVADELGRPMAIVRLGSRIPIGAEFDAAFLFESPPIEWLTENPAAMDAMAGAFDADGRNSTQLAVASTTVPNPPQTLTRVQSEPWFAESLDPNCPCIFGTPDDCNCGACQDIEHGRPDGFVGAWPPDEYICDGGDRQTRVVVNQHLDVSGLDLEDTIAHYDTLDGRTRVTPSNNVCIYAPRFAAVRKLVQVSEDDRLLVMHELDQPLPPITDGSARRPILVDQPLPPARDVGLRGPLALRDRTRGIHLKTALPIHELVRDFEAHEDLQIIRLGIHRTSERPLLAASAMAALEWTDNLAPEVILDDEPAVVDVTVEKAEAIYRVGQGPPRLRLIKVASCCSARPGDEITFTLRFDNIGQQTIGNVTLLDNLTTRLEYITDTAECSLKADFFSDPNDGDSLSLRWEIRELVKPGEGGIIRFRCRVR